MTVETLADLFLVTAGYHKSDHLLHKVGGGFRPVSTAEFVDGVRRLSHALGALGVGRGDRVALMADGGPHWPTVDFAAQCLGAATVPVYPTLLPESAAFIVADSGAKVIFVHRREQLDGLLARRAEMPALSRFVLIEGEPPAAADVASFAAPAPGAGEADPDRFEALAKTVTADDLASLVYTSGTTGQPKGVMLTHRNFVSNVCTAMKLLDIRSEQTALSFLPLSHVFERTVNYCYFYKGVTIAYAESVAAVAQNLQEVKPHVFVSVPRVYEKVLAKVYEGVAKSSPLERKIFRWAVALAREALPYRLEGEHPPGWLGLRLALADGLVFSKIKQRLGGRFEFAISGGAPLGRDVAEFFWSAGIPIYEGYGLTETSPVIAVNTPGAVRLGTVGRPIPGVEVRIAADGEILARGPNVMKGYFGHPEQTAEAIDAAGWFHTGDIGEIDGDGFLSITDRKKEIIVNAYGKNIAPAPIENALKASRLISQAVVIGDRRKYLAALLVPDLEALAQWAREREIDAADADALIADPRVRERVQQEVEAVNANLAHYEQIVAWDLLAAEFTLEAGELTPTQKIKRRVVQERHADRIERLYGAARG